MLLEFISKLTNSLSPMHMNHTKSAYASFLNHSLFMGVCKQVFQLDCPFNLSEWIRQPNEKLLVVFLAQLKNTTELSTTSPPNKNLELNRQESSPVDMLLRQQLLSLMEFQMTSMDIGERRVVQLADRFEAFQAELQPLIFELSKNVNEIRLTVSELCQSLSMQRLPMVKL